MDIFGKRLFASAEEEQSFNRQLANVLAMPDGSADIPAVVLVNKPKGASGTKLIKKFMIALFKGLGEGFLLGLILFLMAWGIFALATWLESTSAILYYPAVFFYYAWPLGVPLAIGYRVGLSLWAKASGKNTINIVSILIGLVYGALVFLFIEPLLIKSAPYFWTSVVKDTGFFINPKMMAGSFGFVVTCIMAVFSVYIVYKAVKAEVKDKRYCESCATYLSDTILLRTPLSDTKNLLLGLFTGNENCLISCSPLSRIANEWSVKERNELAHCSCKCRQTNRLEVKAIRLTPKGELSEERLVFSAGFSAEQLRTLGRVLQSM